MVTGTPAAFAVAPLLLHCPGSPGLQMILQVLFAAAAAAAAAARLASLTGSPHQVCSPFLQLLPAQQLFLS
jgi:hypothetical protein